MAYISKSAKDNDALIDHLRRGRVIKTDRVERAMRRVDRGNYCPDFPYQDAPQSIGYGVTISAPHMHACMLELLKDHATEGASVLDVGCGSGYLTAVFAYMVGDSGRVVGIDHVQELVDMSTRNIKRGNPELLHETNHRGGGGHGHQRLKLVCGDGRLGWQEDAPYDAIHVGAGAQDMPEELIKQLKPGGRLVCPVGDVGYGGQRLMTIDKDEQGAVHSKELMDVMFVPLCDAEDQWAGASQRANPAAHAGEEPPRPYID